MNCMYRISLESVYLAIELVFGNNHGVRRGESGTPLAGVPSLLRTAEKEVETLPASSPTRTEQRGTETKEIQ